MNGEKQMHPKAADVPETTAQDNNDDGAEDQGSRAELLTMGRLGRELEKLDEDVRGRVLAWLVARYVPGRKTLILTAQKTE